MSKINSFTRHVCETEQKATIIMKEGYTKDTSFVPISVRKELVFLTQSYGLKVALRNFHFVFSEIKKENSKLRPRLRFSCITFGREMNLNGLPYIWLDSLHFFRTTLRHFEGDKNYLVELYN